jgi:hypothetical protein
MLQEHPNGPRKSRLCLTNESTYSLVPERHHWIDFGCSAARERNKRPSATIVSKTAEAANVNGSLGCIPKSMLLRLSRYLLARRRRLNQARRPITGQRHSLAQDHRQHPPRLAPSAMRIPIS